MDELMSYILSLLIFNIQGKQWYINDQLILKKSSIMFLFDDQFTR